MKTQTKKLQTEKMVLAALMTALVIVFQLLGEFAHVFGPFATALALIPIVIGASMCGWKVGAWLGFVFGVVVLACPSTQLFYGASIPGTVITVLVKGTACGLSAGLVYELLKKCNIWIRAVAAALVCPIVNTSLFLLGCSIFFMPKVDYFIKELGMSDVAGRAVFWTLATAYFAFEIGSNVVLCPAVVRILNIRNLKR